MTTLGTTPQDTLSGPRRPSSPAALSILVGAAVVVGWVLYRHYAYPHVGDRVFRWRELGRSMWVAELVAGLLLCIPYGLVLLMWGRTLARSLGGAGVAVATALYLATAQWGFERFVFERNGGDFSASLAHTYQWVILLGPALLVPLAWGIARRSGTAWLIGLVAGPAVAAILHELELHNDWWNQHVVFDEHAYHWVLQAAVFVAPFVAGALACWAIDAHGTRPEIGTSA